MDLALTELLFAIISVIITGVIIGTMKIIDKTKFDDLEDSNKIFGIVSIMAIVGEAIYLSISFGLLDFALETITSIGVGLVFMGVAFQNKLKNAAAGISIALNPKINRGDIIHVEKVKGKIIQFGLTKTLIEVEDGTKMIIPNVKFDEQIIVIEPRKKRKKDAPKSDNA